MEGERPKSAWGESDAEAEFQRDIRTGREPVYQPPVRPRENPNIPHSIDPGLPVPNKPTLKERFPNLAPIIEQLDEIERREFWMKNPTALAGENLRQLAPLVDIFKEAMLFRAITENWDEKTLINEYEKKMKDLYTRCASRPMFHEAFGQLMRSWHWFVTPENLNLPGENKHLEKRLIKPNEKGRIAIKLMQLETKFKSRVLLYDNCDGEGPNCYVSEADDYFDDARDEDQIDEDQLEFVEQEAIPLYRMFVIDKAIVHNRPQTVSVNGIPVDIDRDYTGILIALYKSCIKPEE